jgi:hypothetical protein
VQSRLHVQYASFFPVSRVLQALLDHDHRVSLEHLTDFVKAGDKLVSQLITVPGLTDLASDLYGSPDRTYEHMETHKKSDLEDIRRDMVKTCESKERFNALIKTYILAAAENFRDKVGVPPRAIYSARSALLSEIFVCITSARPCGGHVSLRRSPPAASAA